MTFLFNYILSLCVITCNSVVHVMNSLVSSNPAMMTKLRRLKTNFGLVRNMHQVRVVPSVTNHYADALSRRLLRRDLQNLSRLGYSGVAVMMAPRDAFHYRRIGKAAFLRRRIILAELERPWTQVETLLLCPSPDLVMPVVRKRTQTVAPALLLIPDWPRQPLNQAATRLEITLVAVEVREQRPQLVSWKSTPGQLGPTRLVSAN